MRGLGGGVEGDLATAAAAVDEEEEEEAEEEEEEEGREEGGEDQGSFLAWMPERRTSKGLVLKKE